MQIIKSRADASVNFLQSTDVGLIECRYVRRQDDEVIVYVSSQSGCRHACRFCHLTQSGQTATRDLTVPEILGQAAVVLDHYDTIVGPPASVVNFNFMARGEPLAASALCDHAGELLAGLAGLAAARGLVPRVKISSILPRSLPDAPLARTFDGFTPDMYYSLYSVDPEWRRRWLPKAMPAEQGLGKVAEYARMTRKVPVIHFAVIMGENDGEEHVERMADMILATGLRCDINLVRYNPFSVRHGQEAPESTLRRVAAQLARAVPGGRVQIVGRVGPDVNASCGMFAAGPGTRRTPDHGNLPLLPSRSVEVRS